MIVQGGTSGVLNLDENILTSDLQWSFTTTGLSDTTWPMVLGYSPAGLAPMELGTQVTTELVEVVNREIVLQFSYSSTCEERRLDDGR